MSTYIAHDNYMYKASNVLGALVVCKQKRLTVIWPDKYSGLWR